jgi:hypothetical protein
MKYLYGLGLGTVGFVHFCWCKFFKILIIQFKFVPNIGLGFGLNIKFKFYF